MTYTAARVKQEIAKEGILPFPEFLANNVEKVFSIKINPVPLGALILHGSISMILVILTAKLAPLQAYRILVGLYSYTIDAIFGIILAIGIFILRFRSKSFAVRSFLRDWPVISMGAATIYGLSMAFPVCASFVPPSAEFLRYYASSIPWYSVATVSWCCVTLGVVWYGGFKWIYASWWHDGYQLFVERELVIIEHGPENGTMKHETVQFKWAVAEQGAPRMREEKYLVTETYGYAAE